MSGAVTCFSTLGCGELELEDVLRLAVSRGIPAVELRTLGGSIDLPAYFETRYATPERLRDCVSSFDIRIAGVGSSFKIIAARDEERADLLALAPWAVAAGAPRLRVFDGGESGDVKELATIRPTLDWWRELALPLELMIETHDSMASPAVLQDFVDAYPDALILWDTYHTWKTGGEDPSVTWTRVRGRTPHLHIKDSPRGGGAYVPPGEGDYPFGALLSTLRQDRFGGVVSLEWERHWFPDLPPIEAALDGFQRLFPPSASDPGG